MANEKKRETHDEKPAGHAKAEAKHEAHEAVGHGHAHKPNIREYMVIFVVLAVLTVVEVAVTRPELHVPHGPMTLALVGLALTKAAIVALYYMHLKLETKVLKMTVAFPMMAPTIYALVLISEAAWRLTR
jgi:cytochrome c oxidase subunit 4